MFYSEDKSEEFSVRVQSLKKRSNCYRKKHYRRALHRTSPPHIIGPTEKGKLIESIMKYLLILFSGFLVTTFLVNIAFINRVSFIKRVSAFHIRISCKKNNEISSQPVFFTVKQWTRRNKCFYCFFTSSLWSQNSCAFVKPCKGKAILLN